MKQLTCSNEELRGTWRGWLADMSDCVNDLRKSGTKRFPAPGLSRHAVFYTRLHTTIHMAVWADRVTVFSIVLFL